MLIDKKAIIIEFNTYHGEVLPSLVFFLNQLGYQADIYVSPEVSALNPFAMTGSLKYRNHVLGNTLSVGEWQKLIEGYDLLVWNSIEPIKHLEIIRQIKAPTLAVVHNGSRILSKEYQDYFSSPYRQALVLSKNLQRYFQQKQVDVNWIFPSYFSEFAVQMNNNSDCYSFCVQGKVEFKRRNYLSIIRAAKVLKKIIKSPCFDVRIVGKSDSFEGFLLRQLVLFSGVGRVFNFSSKLALYPEYYSELARSDFLCPLIDGTKASYSAYYLDKASSSIPNALGNGLVPVVERHFASLYGIEKLSICYDDGELFAGLEAALSLSTDELRTKKNRVLSENKKLLKQSVRNLADAIDKVDFI